MHPLETDVPRLGPAPSLLLHALLASAVAAGAGCSRPVQPHTHLWAEDRGLHVWTYLRVVSPPADAGRDARATDHAPVPLRAGQTIRLENGTTVTYDGAVILIGNQIVDSANTVVHADGTVQHNAFIRTFD